jgi:hypothetical protein
MENNAVFFYDTIAPEDQDYATIDKALNKNGVDVVFIDDEKTLGKLDPGDALFVYDENVLLKYFFKLKGVKVFIPESLTRNPAYSVGEDFSPNIDESKKWIVTKWMDVSENFNVDDSYPDGV